jgi:hypothetical protein
MGLIAVFRRSTIRMNIFAFLQTQLSAFAPFKSRNSPRGLPVALWGDCSSCIFCLRSEFNRRSKFFLSLRS